MRLLLTLIASLFGAMGPSAFAQAVVQSGPVVPFHAATFFQNGVIADAGSPQTPFLSALGLFGGSSCPLGVSSQTGAGTSTSPYSLFTVCQSPTTTTINIAGVNGAATPSLFFNIGGVNYAFPGPGNGNVAGPSMSVSGDVACFNSPVGTVIKDCGSPAVIAGSPLQITTVSALPACNGALEGARRGVSDALSPSYLAPVSGSGTTHAGVGCNGTSWVAGY
jgi:hypothetical protein